MTIAQNVAGEMEPLFVRTLPSAMLIKAEPRSAGSVRVLEDAGQLSGAPVGRGAFPEIGEDLPFQLQVIQPVGRAVAQRQSETLGAVHFLDGDRGFRQFAAELLDGRRLEEPRVSNGGRGSA